MAPAPADNAQNAPSPESDRSSPPDFAADLASMVAQLSSEQAPPPAQPGLAATQPFAPADSATPSAPHSTVNPAPSVILPLPGAPSGKPVQVPAPQRKQPDQLTAAALVLVPVPLEPPTVARRSSSAASALASAVQKSDDNPVQELLQTNPAVELRIRDQQATAPDPDSQSNSKPGSQKTLAAAALTLDGDQSPSSKPEHSAASAVAAFNAAVPATFVAHAVAQPVPAPPSRLEQSVEAPPPPARASEIMPAERESPGQPIKSFSIDFTADGANGAKDVRLHIAERSGEVRVSIHANDHFLTTKLQDGLHDLVGTLTSAGYDADAWTQGGGHRHPQERPETPPRQSTSTTGNNFEGLLQNPLQNPQESL